MERGDAIARSWLLMQLLDSPTGRTLAELEKELECSRRTVMRDLQGLQKAGIPIYDERDGKEKRWKFVEGFKNRIPPPFTLTELMGLYFVRALCKPLAGTPIQQSVETAFKKIAAILPKEGIAFLAQIDGAITARPTSFKDYSQHKKLIETVTAARAQHKTLAAIYESFTSRQITHRNIDPYQLCYFQGGLYVIAYDHLRSDMRTFALERFVKIELTKETFEVRKDFNYESYMQDALGIFRGPPIEVKVAFPKKSAPFIRERQWHASQQIEDQPDGSIHLTLKVADTLELRRWILGFGKEAEVLEPESLRREIQEEAQALVERLERWDMPPDQLLLPIGGPLFYQ